ncbi:GerMN domain-containing protein [Veillonella montpellierensis]|uniref:GerMN domain-containing protein n=1 Tax=Veillonella montpellierensis TaxID=187328 RepID=UPI0023F8B726|nr:GerMN domain-containing protein [Veillonella montpellierensis]
MILFNRMVAVSIVSMLVIMATGCSDTSQLANPGQSTAAIHTGATIEENNRTGKVDHQSTVVLTIYVPLENAQGVKASSIELLASEATPLRAVQEAINADRQHEYPLFTKNMKVQKVTVTNGLATIDVNQAFITNKSSDLSVQLRLATIVNTLTSMEGIQSVRFTNNGKLVDTIGAFDTRQPISMMKYMIQQ